MLSKYVVNKLNIGNLHHSFIMLFNSFQLIWLFPLIFIGYYLINQKVKSPKAGNIALLAISYLLYMQWDFLYTLILLWVTFVTYKGAIIIQKRNLYKSKKCLLSILLMLSIAPLLIFKYYDFINQLIGDIFEAVGFSTRLPGLNWAIPLGISFYTFQAIGYLWDVYYKREAAERNWWDYMLFVAFFPQILSGPISKARDLMPQIKRYRPFNYSGAVLGLKYLLWGLFLKTVVADQLGLYVDTVFPNYMYHSGKTCLLASIFYSFQIYSDFAGYSYMAMGVARIMGFEVINNFMRPYLSISITDFWRRWHRSLSIWLKDYIYIPLGGSRCSKAKCYRNILVTFLVSGVWHGANWTFILWGGIHGVFQMVERFFNLNKSYPKGGIKLLRIVLTFTLVTLAWVVFRQPDINSAVMFVKQIFTQSGGLFVSTNSQLMFSLMGIVSVVIFDIIQEYYPNLNPANSKMVVVRWSTYLCITLSVLLFGVLDAGQFIYFNF